MYWGRIPSTALSSVIDMNLRPYGESGPLAMSFDALESYYQEQGREWERYAWIKARPVAGDTDAGERLAAALRPFIYRRYLDFGVFASLREMKQMIALEVKRKGMADHVKLGPGGIREVEFFGQIFQLIRGGVIPALQERRIHAVLALLAQEGYITAGTCKALQDAYVFLRNTENRLQAMADAQTHVLPGDRPGAGAACRGHGVRRLARVLRPPQPPHGDGSRPFQQPAQDGRERADGGCRGRAAGGGVG